MTNKTNSADHAYPIFFIYDISLDPDRRSMSIFSKSIRKKILAQYLDVEPESLRFSKGVHGKPILKGKSDLHFNISHTDNYWIMALSKEDEIGVDIEHHKNRKNMDGIVSSYFHSAEHEEYQKQKSDTDKKDFFYHIWTRKEAYAKYLGLGLNYDFSSSDFRNDHTSSVTISTTLIPNTKGYRSTTVSIAHKNMPDNIRVYGNTSLKKLSFSASE